MIDKSSQKCIDKSDVLPLVRVKVIVLLPFCVKGCFGKRFWNWHIWAPFAISIFCITYFSVLFDLTGWLLWIYDNKSSKVWAKVRGEGTFYLLVNLYENALFPSLCRFPLISKCFLPFSFFLSLHWNQNLELFLELVGCKSPGYSHILKGFKKRSQWRYFWCYFRLPIFSLVCVLV